MSILTARLSIRSVMRSTQNAQRIIACRWGWWRVFVIGAIGATVLTQTSLRAEDSTIAFHHTSVLRFASPEAGSSIMGHADEFVQSMTSIDRHLRLGTRTAPDQATYLAFVREQVIAWNTDQMQRVSEASRSLQKRFADLPTTLWPPEVSLVLTTGREEGGAAYCRGTQAIVLPRGLTDQPQEQLERLLCHELFHVLSRQLSDRQQKLYSILGFERVSPIALPPQLVERKLTNPDAPRIDCVITLVHEGQEMAFSPILFARGEKYEQPSANALFGELTFRLMRVHQTDQGWSVSSSAEANSATYLFEPEQLPDYQRHIGRNTKYIIHPEEVLADNFVHLVFQSANLPDPWVVQQLDKTLKTFTLP